MTKKKGINRIRLVKVMVKPRAIQAKSGSSWQAINRKKIVFLSGHDVSLITLD
jgi:hypothetical protein